MSARNSLNTFPLLYYDCGQSLDDWPITLIQLYTGWFVVLFTGRHNSARRKGCDRSAFRQIYVRHGHTQPENTLGTVSH